MVTIDNETMKIITTYMDDEIREQVHGELAPCTNEQFLKRYMEMDSEFIELLESEFKSIYKMVI